MPKGRRSPDRASATERPALSRLDELTIGASGAEVRRAIDWLEQACRRRNVPQAQADRLALCLHEVLANIIAHGGGPAVSAPIGLLLEVGTGQDPCQASVTVSDGGAAFNPLLVPRADPPTALDDASAGGLGLVMIRRCSDWQDYRREEGRNVLTFGARWNSQ